MARRRLDVTRPSPGRDDGPRTEADRLETARLEALRAHAILDTEPEGPFDDIAALAAELADAPMACVSFVDEGRQWFKAVHGLDLREGERSVAFCAVTIGGADPFVVEDAELDERFASAPLVTGPTAVRAYAGAPIVTDAGWALGTVAVFDTRTRPFSPAQRRCLERLARVTMRVLEERRQRAAVSAMTEERHEALRGAHELVLSHLDNTPLAVVEWDQAFQVRRWTRSAEALFGWSSDEVLGRRPEAWPFVHPDDAAAVDAVMRELLEQRAPRNVSRNRNLTRDGREITCDWYNSVIATPAGGMSILSLVEDVTDDLEQERRARNAQRLESVGQLTGGVAHDFNNLLTVITGNADLLDSEHVTTDTGRRLVALIVDAAERGAELTRRLLAFARQQPLEPSVCDVDALVEGMLPLLRRTLGASVTLDVRAGGAFARTASVDAHAFESALLNLVLNARDALPSGGSVAVSTRVETLGPAEAAGVDVAPGRYVVMTVEDSGTGVPPDLVDRVWEPFFTTKASGEGSGMGLAMVYGFARQSGGFTRLRSPPNGGTAVTLAVPWAEGPIERRSVPRTRAVGGGDEHVLVVEDDALVRATVSAQLTALGYTVTERTDGPSALAYLDRDPSVALVFSDVVMPGGMSGYDLAYEARRRRPDLSVLLTSGYSGGAYEASLSAQPHGAESVELLEKPYRREVLAERVRAALRRGGA